MLTICLRGLALAAMLPGIASGQAQSPQDGAAPPPTLHYRSVFDGYRPHNDQAVGPWRDVNDMVGKIGGWRTYAKESVSAGAAAPASPVSAVAPAVPAATAPPGTVTPPAPSGSRPGAHGVHGARP